MSHTDPTTDPNTGTRTDEDLVRAVIAERTAALRDRDPDRLPTIFDDHVVQYTLAPPLRHLGLDVEGARRWMSGFDGPIGWEVADLDVSVGGDVAFAHGLAAMRATPAGAPEGFEMWFRITVGLRKSDGRWRITHLHESTPFHMDMAADGSFRAATDLRP